MTVAEYVVEKLAKYGVTDAFGIPGGVILKLIYVMNQKKLGITPHLTYHEQTAGFAACGYSQATGRIGVAYATRGPGVTNMLTCIAEAYQESLPVFFITAHRKKSGENIRFEDDQEIDVVKIARPITKFAKDVDKVDDVGEILEAAIHAALNGRKGPVVLDFNASLWGREVPENVEADIEVKTTSIKIIKIINEIEYQIKISKRPIILIGDGIRNSVTEEAFYKLASNLKLPILSSRGAQDILGGSPYYFGYIGSHGTRYSNFILSKADLIISAGNRLAFPVNSESYAPIINNKRIIRIEIDKGELNRSIPNAINYIADVKDIVNQLRVETLSDFRFDEWIDICKELRDQLDNCDVTVPVNKLCEYMSADYEQKLFICDVGNNEFWFSRAFEKQKTRGRILCSKSFGALGSGMGRAIGAYYGLKQPVCCIIGDQGFQYNIQELEYIRQWNLPIKIIVINNSISGMIMDHEKQIFGDRIFHVNKKTGYSTPDFDKIVRGYGIPCEKDLSIVLESAPWVYNLCVDSDIRLSPTLPKGRLCQDMDPRIDSMLYETLNEM